VANFYFEIKDSLANLWSGGKYFTTDKNTTENFAPTSQNLMDLSDRVWCEQQGTVWFVKHRADLTTEVDMKEFMWVKLKAESVRA
jgi:hypothetical protein